MAVRSLGRCGCGRAPRRIGDGRRLRQESGGRPLPPHFCRFRLLPRPPPATHPDGRTMRLTARLAALAALVVSAAAAARPPLAAGAPARRGLRIIGGREALPQE